MPRTKYGANTMLSYAGWGTADLDDIVQSSVTALQTIFFAYYRAKASTVITIPSRITQLATNSFLSVCQNQRCTFKIDYINNDTEGMENLNAIPSHADRKTIEIFLYQILLSIDISQLMQHKWALIPELLHHINI